MYYSFIVLCEVKRGLSCRKYVEPSAPGTAPFVECCTWWCRERLERSLVYFVSMWGKVRSSLGDGRVEQACVCKVLLTSECYGYELVMSR